MTDSQKKHTVVNYLMLLKVKCAFSSDLSSVKLCCEHSYWFRATLLIILYLREGADVLSVKVVQLLVNPALLHMSERLTTAGCLRQEVLLGFLQLEITHALLDLPQNLCFD